MMWNGMCNFFSRVMSGETTVTQYAPQQQQKIVLETLEELEPEVEVEQSTTPPTVELSDNEEPLLFPIKTLIFTGTKRQPASLIVANDHDYDEIRTQVARILDIEDVTACIFVQATDQYGLWYQYGKGISHGAVMGKNQQTGCFFDYNPDWMDVEDEISRHGHMIEASSAKMAKKKRERPTKQHYTRSQSKRLTVGRGDE